jgi:hypothetical protein
MKRVFGVSPEYFQLTHVGFSAIIAASMVNTWD